MSLAHSTRASFLRQLGWHDRARGWDGRALALAGSDPEAGADALIGLAADALGVGRFAASAAALRRAVELARPDRRRRGCRCGWRGCRRSWRWPRGDGATAVGHAERAVELAAALGSARHRVKSDVVLAAALCSAGELDASRRGGRRARWTTPSDWDWSRCAGRWPACSADIGSATLTRQQRSLTIRDECADTVRRRGGVLADR